LRTKLAGEPNIRRSANAAQRRPLVSGSGWTDLAAGGDAHPTGRTSRPAAAHRGVRQMKAATRLQHRPTTRDTDIASRIRHGDELLAATLEQIADLTGDKCCTDDAKIPIEEVILPLRDGQSLRGIFRTQVL